MMIYGMRHVENTTQIGLRKPTSCLSTEPQMDSLQITISQEPLWHQVVKYDIHDRKWGFCLIQVKLSAAAAHFVPITRLININQSFVTCYLEQEWMQETWRMEKEGRRQERPERRPTETCHKGHSYYPNMQFQAENVEFCFCGSAANQ